MSGRTQRGVRIVEAALLLGLIGDTLLGQASGLGINFFAWTCALITATWWLERTGEMKSISPFARRWRIPATMLFAACVAWRASDVLRTLDLIIVALLFALILAESRTPRTVLFAGVARMMTNAARGVAQILTGFVPLVFADVRWREVAAKSRWSRHAAGIMRGLAIGVPLVLFFGVLFMAADAVFSRLVNDAFRFDAENIFTRVLLTVCFTWLAGGFLRSLFLADAVSTDSAAIAAHAPPKFMSNEITTFRLGMTETGIVLGLLNAIFALSVVVQLRYLFGGAERVAVTDGLTYAEYARHGFLNSSRSPHSCCRCC